MKALILQKREPEDTAPLYRLVRGSTRLLATVLLGLAFHLLAASSALAYMGGPLRTYIGGLEQEEQRVYYYLVDHSEAAVGPRVWYYDLNGASPEQPKRASRFDGQDGVRIENSHSDAWRSLATGLVQLGPLKQFDLRIALSVENAGQDSLWMTPRYKGSLLLETGGMGRTIDVTLYCEPMVRVRGPYGIPGRPEEIVVVTYRGRPEGCEEMERPVLLVSGGEYERDMKISHNEVQPASWGARSHGGFGGQFYGRFGEAGPSEDAVLWYLSQDYVMAGPPKVWLVGLDDDPPTQPIRYGMPEADSVMGGWAAYSRLTKLGGRRTYLRGISEFDLTLRLKADSVGVDSTIGVPRYKGRLVAETPDGTGAVDLTMFCNTLIQVRGVFGLPERPEVALFVTYTGESSECGEDVPLIIYPGETWRDTLE